MDLGLHGKVALVTASSKGLGRGVAEALAQEGADLILCARDEAALKETAAAISAATGRQVLAVKADVSRPEEIERLVAAGQERFGHIDILVANAGGPRPGKFLELSDADWQAAFELTLMSAVRLTRAVLPGMLARRWGRILYITSSSVKQPIPNLLLSNSLRAAVTGMAKTLSAEVAGHGVTVNCLAPGRIDTDRVRFLDAETARQRGITAEEVRREQEARIPAGRYGDPLEFGRAAAFLCSEAAGYITGVTLQVDGGLINTLW
ncbi:MAG: SDR family oxidoreductase [Firmicutes bacterium]|nr:SDR family oxidoreductase [Bacillota bacterium]